MKKSFLYIVTVNCETHTTLLKHIVTQRENERMRERKRQKRDWIITNCDNASEERKSVQHLS